MTEMSDIVTKAKGFVEDSLQVTFAVGACTCTHMHANVCAYQCRSSTLASLRNSATECAANITEVVTPL